MYYLLQFKSTLENVSKVNFSMETLVFHFEICEEKESPVSRSIYFSMKDIISLANSRGTVNFSIKWPDSKKQSSINILSFKNVTRTSYTEQDSEQWVPIIGFDVRGLFLKSCSGVTDGVSIISSKNYCFDNVDLLEDWCDYDIEGCQSVGLYNIAWNLVEYKK
jgi:hypothetical protein